MIREHTLSVTLRPEGSLPPRHGRQTPSPQAVAVRTLLRDPVVAGNLLPPLLNIRLDILELGSGLVCCQLPPDEPLLGWLGLGIGWLGLGISVKEVTGCNPFHM